MTVWNTPTARGAFSAACWHMPVFLIALLLLASCAQAGPPRNNATAPTQSNPTPTAQPQSPYRPGQGAAQALSECTATASVGGCYSPEQVQTFYDLNPLYEQGVDGKGQTIVILDSFGSPTITRDLQVFDQTFGLPDPPSLEVQYPLGPVNFNASSSDEVGWAGETTLDVEWAHAIAPGAGIVLLVSPVSETEGVQGFPEFEHLSTYAMDHHLGQVFSMSFTASEPTLVGDACNEHLGTGEALLKSYDRTVLQRAVAEHITMFAGSGDFGATDIDCSLKTPYPFPVVGWPATDPLVTAVGGTTLSLKDEAGQYGSEKVWNDAVGSGGGGLSRLFGEPAWQQHLPNQATLQGKRGVPDVSWGAAANYALYHSYPGARSGWGASGGTSASTPQWAGVIALANQMAGKPLGFLNPALYQLAGKGFHDITTGDNTFAGVQGFPATSGWDLATGWGTPDAAVLLPLLIAVVQQTTG